MIYSQLNHSHITAKCNLIKFKSFENAGPTGYFLCVNFLAAVDY